MKSKLLIFLIFSLFILVNEGCTTNKTEQNTRNNIPLYSENKEINIKLKNGKAEITFDKEHLNTVTLVFDTEGYNHINATIVSEGNIRFNTVGFDNEEDGPYGKELDLPLNKSGLYNLNLSPSLMAENYAKNIFKVTVYIKLTNRK